MWEELNNDRFYYKAMRYDVSLKIHFHWDALFQYFISSRFRDREWRRERKKKCFQNFYYSNVSLKSNKSHNALSQMKGNLLRILLLSHAYEMKNFTLDWLTRWLILAKFNIRIGFICECVSLFIFFIHPIHSLVDP